MEKQNGEKIFEAMQRVRQINIGKVLGLLPPGEFFLLSQIDENRKNSETVNVSELAVRLDISAPAISRTLRHLEEKGYILRETDKTDRRNTFVLITDTGTDTLSACKNQMRTFTEKVYSCFTDEEAQIFVALLNKLQNKMKTELAKIADGKDFETEFPQKGHR